MSEKQRLRVLPDGKTVEFITDPSTGATFQASDANLQDSLRTLLDKVYASTLEQPVKEQARDEIGAALSEPDTLLSARGAPNLLEATTVTTPSTPAVGGEATGVGENAPPNLLEASTGAGEGNGVETPPVVETPPDETGAKGTRKKNTPPASP